MRLLRRIGTKRLALLLLALIVSLVVVYEGQYLPANSVPRAMSSYNHLFEMKAFVTEPPTTSTSGLTTTDMYHHAVYSKRRQVSENACLMVHGGAVLRMTRYGNVSYCVVPKVGSTFWLNIFRYLHNDTGKTQYSSPFDIPRMVTHYGPRKTMKYYNMNASYTPSHLATDLRFMFVREPYSRLWSAYVDKFLLIDYWRSEGQKIVKSRKNHPNGTSCANDVSFEEFVNFVLNRDSKRLNEHWQPIQMLCSPCMYRPHIIGKVETFSQDSRYVTERLNISRVLASHDHDRHVFEEMDMLIAYNFQLLGAKFYANCTNSTDLSRRLWRTFQINGYLSNTDPFPPAIFPNVNSSQFRDLVHEAYRKRTIKDPDVYRRQRKQAMIDAYKQISLQNLKKVQQLYKHDFETFDYDPQPAELFQNRSS